jgi:hypothetical protein
MFIGVSPLLRSSSPGATVKSSDGGRTWREADAANRPEADDLESVAGQTAGHRVASDPNALCAAVSVPD